MIKGVGLNPGGHRYFVLLSSLRHPQQVQEADASDWGKRRKELKDQYDMHVQEGNEAFVHHMLIMGCTDEVAAFNNRPGPCYDGSLEDLFMQYRDSVLARWAVSGEAFVYPDNMGLAWYSEEYNYVVGEFHYDNSNLKKSWVSILRVISQI